MLILLFRVTMVGKRSIFGRLSVSISKNQLGKVRRASNYSGKGVEKFFPLPEPIRAPA
jgi:hypothetical protein